MFYLDRYQKKILIFFIFILYFWIVYKSYVFTSRGDGYILGDWLINYQDGGFKRRGLSGSFFFFLQNISGFSLKILVWSVQIILYSIFFYYLVKTIIRIYDKDLIFLFTPVTLLFWFYNSYAIGRKEIILLTILMLYCNDILTNKKNYLRNGILLGISVLFHELTFFYLTYFLYIYLFIEKGKISFNLFKLLFFPFICILSIYFFSDYHIFRGRTFEILFERGVILDDLSLYTQNYNLNLNINFFNFKTLSYFFVVVFNLLFFYLRYLDKKKFFYILLCWLPSIFLFANGIDWGRWIFINFFINTIILIIFSLKNRNILSKFNIKILYFYLIISLSYKMEFQEKGFMFNPIWSKIITIVK